jgi:murein L,D-transpeptidase YafK
MKQSILLSSVIFTGTLLTAGLFTHNTPASSSASRGEVKTNKYSKRNGFFNSQPVGEVSIVIDKTDYELSVYDKQGWYATYPVVFGNNSLDDKKVQGDRNTPEGVFQITAKRPHEKWYRFMSLNYPTAVDREKFNLRKKRGEIPANAVLGGGIGIHGVFPHEDFVIDRYKNWTLGCISMKNDDVEEVYGYVTSGTKVTIKK